ncbi:MAG TPA: tripartite tricarboxylate transporter substrate binding protein [Xanthobacteraceae bacterium]|nr:tripartite tricarboxylate transporter substrate binding protein [Xanthobacteraceae bacterium]
MTLRVPALAAVLLLALAAPAGAQDYPTQPIHLVIPFGPGGGSDIVGRILAQALQDKLGQPVVVDNRPGAGGTIGNDVIARSPADGYTLGIMTAGQIIQAVMLKALPYDARAAFDPVAQVATAGLMMVTRPDFPANDVKDLIALAKAKPGKLVFGSPGFGATQHLAAELFKQTAGVDMLHVPFRTSPEVTTALLAGNVDVVFETVSAVLGQVQAGKLKALAVTGKDRFPAVPNVPAAIESGLLPGYDVTTWYGVFVPHGTPGAIIAKLNAAINASIAEPDLRERLTKAGVVVKGSTPEEFGTLMERELTRWETVREKAGLERR